VGRIVIWIAAALLAGCTSYGTEITEAQASQFEKGKSTEDEVVGKLGRPSAMSALLPDGSHNITYSYSRLQMSAASYLPVVGALEGETNASVTVCNFTFDAVHRLIDWNSTLKNTTDKMGLLNQVDP
jgi:outer membrane protein assembly factor BamE (lipoprotein component of BamABCDE complex)